MYVGVVNFHLQIKRKKVRHTENKIKERNKVTDLEGHDTIHSHHKVP